MHILTATIRRPYFWIQNKLPGISQWLTTLLEGKKQKSTIASLDGVRAIACLMVIVYHISFVTLDTQNAQTYIDHLVGSILQAGGSGVSLFFVLSGFLLFLPYAKALLFDYSWPEARHFYLRRVFRIVPAYYASLLLMIFIFQPDYLQPDHLKDLGLFLIFFMDASKETFLKINPTFWTLAVEWQYYMLLPLLALGIGFIVRHLAFRRRFWTVVCCLLAVIAWGLCSRYWGLYFAAYPSQTFLVPRSVLNGILFFTYGMNGKFLEDFAVGMLISLCYVFARQVSPEHRFTLQMRRLSPWLLSGALLLLLFTAVWQFSQYNDHGWPFLDSFLQAYGWSHQLFLSTGFGLCIVAILFGSAALRRPFEWLPLRWIGLISYSLFIWHTPLLGFFMYNIVYSIPHWNPDLAFGLCCLWTLLLIVPFSFIFYMLVEKPGMRWGDRLRPAAALNGEKPPAFTRGGAIRVCTITFDWYPFEPRVLRLVKAAVDAGCAADVICLRQPHTKRYEELDGVRVYRMPLNRGFGVSLAVTILYWCLFLLCAGATVTWLHLRRAYDVIHVHNMPDFLVFSALIPKLLGAKVVLDIQDVSPELMSAKAKQRARAFVTLLATWQERLSTAFAHHVVTVGWPFEQLLLQRGVPQGKMTVILNSADTKLFPSSHRHLAPAVTGAEAGARPFVLMYHGTLAKRNCLDTAIRAAALARQSIPNIRLDIQGQGEQLPVLKQLAVDLGVSEHVVFSNPCPPEKIVDFVTHGDLGIIPYGCDGFMELVLPTKAYEFAWMHRPMIASDTCAIRSMFRPESIVLCDHSSPESFARAIVDLYYHPEKRARMVHSAAEDYIPYQWDNMCTRYHQLLISLTGKRVRISNVPQSDSGYI